MNITPASQNIVQNNLQAQHEHKNLLEGIHFKFPVFKHNHPPIIDVNQVADERLTTGQRIADGVASVMGSWRFIIIQATIMVFWVTLNSVAWFFHFDNYPYILLNLAMSAQAAFATPLIMMSQNRQSAKDRIMAESDYHCNLKGEEETRNIMEHLDHQDEVTMQIIKRMEAQHKEVLYHLGRLDPELARRLGMDIQEVSKELVEEETEDAGGNS